MQIERVPGVRHLHKGVLLLAVLVADARAPVRLAKLADVEFRVGVGVFQNRLEVALVARGGAAAAAAPPAHAGARARQHATQRRAEVVRVAQ